MTPLPRRTTPTLLIAAGCLLLGSTGGAAAGRLVSGKQIKDNSVTSRDIRNRTLGTQDLAPDVRAALERDPWAGKVTRYTIVTEQAELAAGSEASLFAFCPEGTRVLGASGWWDESNEAVAVVIGDAGTYVGAFTEGIRSTDTLVARATCGAVIPATPGLSPRGSSDKGRR